MGTAIVTGASAGIGAVFARRLAERGDDLVLVARRTDRLEALRGTLGTRVECIGADLADPSDLARVAERAAGDDVTVLVNNAGINGYGPFAEIDPVVLTGVLAVNVTAPAVLARAALPGMLARGEGAIVNVASLLAFAASLPPGPLPVRATYAGTKGFMVTWSRTLAAELGDTPVTVQVLCPGYTATEFHMSNGTEPVEGEPPEDQPFAMSAEDVVQASLAGLELGEVVCAPGVQEPEAFAALAQAEAGIRGGDRRPRLAERYITSR